jgi:hypothetical protein
LRLPYDSQLIIPFEGSALHPATIASDGRFGRGRSQLLESFLTATHYGWRRRGSIFGLLLVLWLPVELVIARLPTERHTVAQMSIESMVEPLWIGALLHLCRADLRQKPIGMIRALRRASNSYVRLFGIRAVLEVRILFGLVAGFVPGLVMAANYALMDVLAICEEVGPSQCRTRSTNLVKGHVGAVLVLLVLANLVPLGLDELVELASQWVQGGVVTALLHSATFVVTAFLPLTLFEFYRSHSGAPSASQAASPAGAIISTIPA